MRSTAVRCGLRRFIPILVCAVAAGTAWPGQSAAQPADDAKFRETYRRQYQALNGVAPDMVVMELRDRVELVASRGSQVGAAGSARRVSGFESALLQGLQRTACSGSSTKQAPTSEALIEGINGAASAQQLRLQASDVAELVAMAQRLIEGQPRERWCALRSLDDVR